MKLTDLQPCPSKVGHIIISLRQGAPVRIQCRLTAVERVWHTSDSQGNTKDSQGNTYDSQGNT